MRSPLVRVAPVTIGKCPPGRKANDQGTLGRSPRQSHAHLAPEPLYQLCLASPAPRAYRLAVSAIRKDSGRLAVDPLRRKGTLDALEPFHKVVVLPCCRVAQTQDQRPQLGNLMCRLRR